MHRTLLTLTVVYTTLLNGCGRVAPALQSAPEIPPASSMVIDFSDFQGSARGGSQALPGSHWTWAATHVAVWNLLLTVTFAVPVTAFLESFNHEPQLQDDDSWAWSYEVVAGGVTHRARLEARGAGSNIEWRMWVSRSGSFEDFLWFSGESNLTNTAGTWTLYTSPAMPDEAVLIEWSRAASGETGQIKYTNIMEEAPGTGGYISYGLTDSGAHDAFYDIFNAQEDNLIGIDWNSADKSGRILDAQRFGDEQWRCWDTQLLNADCAEQ